MVVMTTGIGLSQELFAVNMLRTLKSSLKHRRKHVLRSLQLYGDQALEYENSEGRESNNHTKRLNWSFFKEAPYRNLDMSQQP